jgi:Tol biopolymer transport system component
MKTGSGELFVIPAKAGIQGWFKLASFHEAHFTNRIALVLFCLFSPFASGQGSEDFPDYLIGYTQFRNDIPGGQFYNTETARAWVVRGDGTGHREIASDLPNEPHSWTQFAGWSPDGKKAIIGRGWEDPENAAWEREHQTFRMTEGWLYDMFLVDLETGESKNLTAIDRVSIYNTGLFYWPDDPTRLGFQALIDGISHPFSMDLDGRYKRDLTEGSGEFAYGFEVSPDGERIAYHSNYQIVVANRDGSAPEKIDTGNPFNFVPQWSPDGEWLMFVSGEHYDCHPTVVRRDGTGLRKLADRNGHPGVVEPLEEPDFHSASSDVPVWSGDGRWIYYTAKMGDNVELMRVDLVGKTQRLTESPQGSRNYHPKLSPDGRWVVFGSDRTGTMQLLVMPAGGGEPKVVTDAPAGYAAMHAHWRPVSGNGSETTYRISTFSADVTVPLGHALMGGGIAAASEVVDPLLAKGIVLSGSGAPLVLVSVDWCEIRNAAYDRWREALAEAAGTSRERVLVSSVHVHDAPVADLEAQRLLDQVGLEKSLCDVEFHEQAVQKVAEALKDSLKEAVPVTHYGIGEATVEKVASNRRVLFPYGVKFPRNSATSDEEVRAAPEGTIDPKLKTVSFWNGDQPVAALSGYAVHPMSYYGKGGVSYDFVGMGREKRQAETPDVFQAYFSGCSGDVTAGKYNTGAPENRPVLADKMYQGMKKAWENTAKYPLTSIGFRNVALELPVRDTPGFSMEEMKATLANPEVSTFNRNLAAMGISWRKRTEAGRPIDVPALDFGKAQILLMPAESFVQYQLDAQAARPDSFVMVLGYGECAPGYIPSKQATEEKFIETHTWCWVHPGADVAMMKAIGAALATGKVDAKE